MSDLDRLRAFAQGYIDEANHIVDVCGVVGGHIEVARAEVARKLLDQLDAIPPPTSPDRIPPAIRSGLDRYAKDGIRPGDCLYAILCGDLFGAFARADPETRDAMPAIVVHIENRLPGACGGEDVVERWIARPRS